MIMCPNTKNPDVAREFNELVLATSEAAAYHIWSLNNGNAIDKAPNGAESKLFLTLLEHYNGDRVKAIQAKAKVYGRSFIQWFGDWTSQTETKTRKSNSVSKVVDENGEPLVVWHGGSRYIGESGKFIIPHEIEELYDDAGNIYPGRDFNLGAFFTSDKKYAEHFMWGKGEEYIYPVYLNIKNPAYSDKMASSTVAEIYDNNWINTTEGMAEFDGVIGHDAKTLPFESTGTEYAVYNPNQIKSVDNQGPTPWEGTFSREDDIYYSINALQWYENLKSLAEDIVVNKLRISLKDFNKLHGTNFQYNSEQKTGLRYNKNPKVRGVSISNKNDKLVDNSLINKQLLINYLTKKFGLLYKIVDDAYYSWEISADAASTCCVRGNTVYIKQSSASRVTNEQFIEEFLHPMVHNVYTTNRTLSDKLLKEAKKDFPDLTKQIEGLYKAYGQDVINEETIAQILSKYVLQEVSYKGFNNRNLIDYIKNFLSEIFDKIKDLFGDVDINYLESTKSFIVNGKDIKDVLNYKQFAELINSKQLVFNDTLDKSDIRHSLSLDEKVVVPPLKQRLELKKNDLLGEIRKLQDKINTLERNFIRKIPGKNMILSTPYGDLASTYGFIDNNPRSIFGSVSAQFKINENIVESSLLFPNKWMFTPDNNYTRLDNSLRRNQPQITYNVLEYLKLQGFNRVYSSWLLEHKVLNTQIPDVDLGVMGFGMFLEMSGKHASDELIEEFNQLYGKGAGQLLSVEKRPDPNDEKATQFRVSANIDELLAKIKQNNPEVRVSNDYIELIKSTQDSSHERSEEDKQMARSEIEKLVELQREYTKQISEIEEQIKEEQNKEFKEWQEYLKTLGGDLEESCALPF